MKARSLIAGLVLLTLACSAAVSAVLAWYIFWYSKP